MNNISQSIRCFFGFHIKGPWEKGFEGALKTTIEIPTGRMVEKHMGIIYQKYCTRCDKYLGSKREWGEIV